MTIIYLFKLCCLGRELPRSRIFSIHDNTPNIPVRRIVSIRNKKKKPVKNGIRKPTICETNCVVSEFQNENSKTINLHSMFDHSQNK